MKKLLLLSAGLFALTVTNLDAKTLYGYQAWEASGVENPMRGPIMFDSEDPAKAVIIKDCSQDGVAYSGYYYNYHWYAQFVVKGTQSSVDGVYEIDLATGNRTLIAKGGSKMIDLTYDYSRDRVWGIRTGNQWFAEFNPATGASTLVGKFQDNGTDVYMLALACALDGTVYGVSSHDVLYKVDVTNGALTAVGSLGYDAGFDQTMAFDYATGTLYWCNNADYNLYTINTATGAATPVGSIGPNGVSSMASLFVPYINVAVGAPDRVTAVTGAGGADNATLSWTNPVITAQGDALTALDGVLVIRDGQQVADVKLTAADCGKTASYTDPGLVAGQTYAYELVPYNSAGRGGVDANKVSVRVGLDTPAAPGNFAAAAGDGSAILSWTAPTVGAHGGQFSAADITGYEVRRGNSVIANVAADVLRYEDKVAFGTYSYSVAAKSAAGTGDAATLQNVLVKPANWIIMTNGEVQLEAEKDYKFYDEGGPNANYYNSRSDVLVLAPADPAGYVTMAFNSLNIDTYYDNIKIYHGRGTEGTLVGSFNGSTVPAELRSIESAAADGCLTVTFDTDIMDVAAGWDATVRVNTLKNIDLQASDFAASPMAIAGAATKASVKVQNKGVQTANGYTVELLDGVNVLASVKGPELASRQGAVVELTYTPQAEGMLELSARVIMAGDEDNSNNATAYVSQKVLAEGSNFVDIFAAESDASGLAVVPMSFMGVESLCEVLYPAAELSGAVNSRILSIIHPLYSCTKGYENVPVRIYVGETDAEDLTATIPASKLVKVFDGNVNIATGDADITFNLDTPYEYQGGNLVVMIHKLTSPTDNSGINFSGCYGYYDNHKKCSRFTSRWDADDDELNPETTSLGYSANDMRPDIRLVVNSGSGSVSDITVDANAPVEYFNLQGIRIAEPAAGQVVIRRQGASATKIVVK